MNSKMIVREIMKLRGHTYETLAKKLGLAKPSGVSERLRGTTEMRVDTLVKLLSEMDCQLVIRSTLQDRTEWIVSADTIKED
jgi:transcriptional regulator with XRE-family HTH domain